MGVFGFFGFLQIWRSVAGSCPQFRVRSSQRLSGSGGSRSVGPDEFRDRAESGGWSPLTLMWQSSSMFSVSLSF
jgi:hypothetical protein